MGKIVFLLGAGLLAMSGCSGQRSIVRPGSPPVVRAESATPEEEPKPPRINNSESETVQNWSNGNR